MRRCLTPLLALLLGACQHPAGQTQVITLAPDMTLNRSETVIDSPAGPTRRVEFKRAVGGELVRLEFQHLTSGRLVWGQTALRVDGSGQWLLFNRNDDTTTAKFKPATAALSEACKPAPLPQGKTVLAAEFSVNGTPWRAQITRVYEQPKAQPGISNESEPAVDLVACKI
jgi:hypothetical protein